MWYCPVTVVQLERAVPISVLAYEDHRWYAMTVAMPSASIDISNALTEQEDIVWFKMQWTQIGSSTVFKLNSMAVEVMMAAIVSSIGVCMAMKLCKTNAIHHAPSWHDNDHAVTGTKLFKLDYSVFRLGGAKKRNSQTFKVAIMYKHKNKWSQRHRDEMHGGLAL